MAFINGKEIYLTVMKGEKGERGDKGDNLIPKILSNNVADLSLFEAGGYYQYNNGQWLARSDISATGLIPCNAGEIYYLAVDDIPLGESTPRLVGGNVTFWNGYKEYVSGVNVTASEGYFVVPSGVKYFRSSLYTTEKDRYRINLDSVKPLDDYNAVYEFDKNIKAPNITSLESKVENISGKNKLYYSNTYNDNITVLHKRNEKVSTSYNITVINKEKFDGTKTKVTIAGTSDSNSLGDSNCLNVINFAKKNDYIHVINGGIYLVSTMEADGITIIDGNILKSTGVEQFNAEQYVLGINANGEFKSYINETAANILAGGYIYALTGFVPLIENGVNVSESILSVCPHYNVRHPRQIIGTLADGNYFTFCCDGRINGENGMTLQECIDTITKDLNVVFAFNLDGGGSAQSTVGKKQINRQIDGRKIPNVICFK